MQGDMYATDEVIQENVKKCMADVLAGICTMKGIISQLRQIGYFRTAAEIEKMIG